MLDSCSLEQATRRLSVWRSNFSSTAIALVAHFLASDGDDTKSFAAIQETCLDLLDGFAFLYQDLDPTTAENAYRSCFFLQLFAHAHLRPCIGCPDIPRLNTDDLKEHGVKGAMSLCCSAVGHSLSISGWQHNSCFSSNVPFVYSTKVNYLSMTRSVPMARLLQKLLSSPRKLLKRNP